ncbi:glycerophosphodiester phosphodiesterase family protein [Shimia ponticola]|uniref:glycerophosphodiester phosphodiesterase family protein n=1 Tax=Shimia ponticola TaxID=2582893 RepID=UPI0011BE6E1F|nr:glycerophosphodiester phosphodiesterase family protein [Shimia ponticola]
MTGLPSGFLDRPFAHRGLHGPGRPENSREAIMAAIDAGFGIEIDVQRSADGHAMVFHDYGLTRLTGAKGTVQTTTADELDAIGLLGGPTGAPKLPEVLSLIDGQVPLVIEIKDQDGAMGPNVGPLEYMVARNLADYRGPVAVMSFNPHSMQAMADLAPDIPRGLVTCGYDASEWPLIPAQRREELAQIPDYDRIGACFISHDAKDLGAQEVAARKALGTPVLCWTIRSPKAADDALEVADQITFEGYLPA